MVGCPTADSRCQGKIFVIKKGENLTSIAQYLKKENLVRSSLAFRILVLAEGLTGKIQAGSFQLAPTMPAREIAKTLTRGTLDIWLTFPEGWRREEFGRRLVANLPDFDYQEFLHLTEGKEGFLFPDTYLIPKEAEPTRVVGIFEANFEEKALPLLRDETEARGLDSRQIVILASIVEREVRQSTDRPLVAGILVKRWENDWPLQADATLQYALANVSCRPPSASGGGGEIPEQAFECDWWPKISKKDKQIDSPYNTYQFRGLPPAPICNPGLDSIKAVISSRLSDYWFYLSDAKGRIHYARTVEEHNQNIARYLQ